MSSMRLFTRVTDQNAMSRLRWKPSSSSSTPSRHFPCDYYYPGRRIICASISTLIGNSGYCSHNVWNNKGMNNTCSNFFISHEMVRWSTTHAFDHPDYESIQQQKQRKQQQQQQLRPQPPPHPQGKYLNIKECNSIEEVCDIAFLRLHELNPRNISSFWTKISQLLSTSSTYLKQQSLREEPFMTNHHQQQHQQEQERSRLKDQLICIYNKTTSSLSKFDPRDLTQTALGFAKISREIVSTDTTTRIRSHHHHPPSPIQSNSHSSNRTILPQDKYIYHDILCEIIFESNSDHVRTKEQQKMDEEDVPRIFQWIADASNRTLHNFEPRFLSNLAYANAIAGVAPTVAVGVNTFIEEKGTTPTTTTTTTLFDRITEVSLPQISEFNAQDLSNIVWAYEKVGVTTFPLFEKVSNTILELDNLNMFPPQALSNILLAFAKRRRKEEDRSNHGPNVGDINNTRLLFEKVAEHIIHVMTTTGSAAAATTTTTTTDVQRKTSSYSFHQPFTAQAIANIVWSYATINIPHPELFDSLAYHILHTLDNDNLNSFKTQELSNIVWAYASTNSRQVVLFSKVADHILLLLRSRSSSGNENCSQSFDKTSFNAQNISNILWAYSTANIIHPELFEAISHHVLMNSSKEDTILQRSLENKVILRNLLRASEKAQRVLLGSSSGGGGNLREKKIRIGSKSTIATTHANKIFVNLVEGEVNTRNNNNKRKSFVSPRKKRQY